MSFNLRNVFGTFSIVFATLTLTAQEPEAVPGEFIVKFRSQHVLQQTRSNIETMLRAQVKERFGTQKIFVIQRSMLERSAFVVNELLQDPEVEYAEPNYLYRINRQPNDRHLKLLWGINNIGQADPTGTKGTTGYDIGALKAWDIQTGNKTKIVAVIDTGVDYNHPDLKENMWVNQAEAQGHAGIDDDKNGVIDDIYGYNAAENNGNPMDGDEDGHGSHCAGTIGARGNNGIGVAGVNWDTRIMAIKFMKNGTGSTADAIRGIDYAVKMGAKVLSNSWSGGGNSTALKEAIERANRAGAVFIAAAGNETSNNDAVAAYPANYAVPNVISVAAVNNRGALAGFSNYGARRVHLGAPGVNILSTMGGTYKSISGTSMAAPHVAGVAALLWANEPALTGLQIRERLLTTTTKASALQGKTTTGGIVNAHNALTKKTR